MIAIVFLGGYGILPYPRSLSLSSLLHLFIFLLERLGREKVLKVVGLNPTGITRGAAFRGCTFLY